jgi:hypothetical protein
MAVVLSIKHERDDVTRELPRRWPELAKKTLIDTARHWHDEIFPEHFGPRNRSKYGFEPRRPLYLNVIKQRKGEGIGKYRDEVLTGKAERQMQYLFKITGTSRLVRVRMSPETYFYNPFVGSFTDPQTGRQKIISRQPDKPDEVTRCTEDDKDALREFSAERLAKHLEDSRPPPRRVTFGP